MKVIRESEKSSCENMSAVSADLRWQWLMLYQDRFEAFYYNVCVGAGGRPPAHTTPDRKLVC